ncbi:MAG: LysR family transcriptional regulator [Oscillospiraceae bacterium]
MDIRLLSHFLVVAKYKNITRAAEALYLTQPTLSKQITTLEEQLGVKLLERNNRFVELTEAGLVLYDSGTQLMQQIEEIESKARVTAAGRGRSLIIFSENLDNNKIVDVFRKFKVENPWLEVSLRHTQFENIMEELNASSIDAAFIRSFEAENLQHYSRYHVYRVYKTRMIVAMSKNHKFAHRSSIRLNELNGERLVYKDHLKHINSSFWKSLIGRSGTVPLETLPSTNDDMVFSIQVGDCISFVDKYAAKHFSEFTGCVLVDIEDDDTEFYIYLLAEKQNYNSALTRFIKAITEAFPEATQLQ